MSYIETLEAAGERATPGPLQHFRYRHGGGRSSQHDSVGRQLVADHYYEGDREWFILVRTCYPQILAVLRAAEFLNEPHERTSDEVVSGTVDMWAASDALRQAVEDNAKGGGDD